MSGSRNLFLNIAAAAAIASVLMMAAPAAALETIGTAEARMTRASSVAKGYATRAVATAGSDRRQDVASAWRSRQFVLIIGIGF